MCAPIVNHKKSWSRLWDWDDANGTGIALDDLKSSHANLSSDKSALDLHHATLKDRVEVAATKGISKTKQQLTLHDT